MTPEMSEGKHTKQWHRSHEKILEAMRNGAKTWHEIYMMTGLSYHAIYMHKKEMKESNPERLLNKTFLPVEPSPPRGAGG